MPEQEPRVDRVPSATYRVQLTPDFGFALASEIVPYLSRLGISDLYCSPILTARPGSTHGYDVVDPLHLNPELGGEAEFDRLVERLHLHQMGLLLDIVPNHMAASTDNPWWLNVLENGPSSRYAGFFDIEWIPAGPSTLENRVLLPVLGSPYGEALESGEIRIEPDEQGVHLQYYDLSLPMATISYGPLLRLRAAEIERALGTESDDWRSFSNLLEMLENVPGRAADDQSAAARRREVRAVLRDELPRLRGIPAIERELERAVAIANGTPGEPRSFDLLDRIVSSQAYRLAFWQLAREQINYRRFFDVNDLVSVRVEDPAVFDETHELILKLADAGSVDGLRVDHVDGLWDPEGYLDRLQRSLTSVAGNGTTSVNRYVLVEKILSEGENLRQSWPVAGTTGYDFMTVMNGLMVDPDGLNELDRVYREMTGEHQRFAEMVYQAKRQVLEQSFTANVESLTSLLAQIAVHDRHGRDLTVESLREALLEVTAALPIYRTYVNGFEVDDQDRSWIEVAVEQSITRRPDLRHTLAFLRRVLLLRAPPYLDDDNRQEWLGFVMRWQQLSGPAMAKGSEDTALYRYNRLISLNEVGGRPDTGGVSVEEFHAHCQRMVEEWPYTMNALSTHDTKRSEDVRARIAVLSEMPFEWERALLRWREMNAGKRPVRNGVAIPDANVELLIYQTLLGAWPFDATERPNFQQRLKEYLIKASREAKTFTNWTEPDSVYEDALHTFVDAIFDMSASAEFLTDFQRFLGLITRAGAVNSLSQTLLKLTVPGVPDTYQGTDLWDLSLVDPDNRRSVDFDRRREALSSIDRSGTPDLADILRNWQDGRVKLLVARRALALRGRNPDLFSSGSYLRCEVSGPQAQHLVAFARRTAQALSLTVVPRLVSGLIEPNGALALRPCWEETFVRLAPGFEGQLTNLIDGTKVKTSLRGGQRHVAVSDVLLSFPVGLLAANA